MNYEHNRDKVEWFKLGENTCLAHFHRSIELIYCVSGCKTVVADGVSYDMSEGDFLLLPPFTVHLFPSTQAKSLCVVMPVEYSNIFEDALGEKALECLVFTDKSVTKEAFKQLLKLENESSPLAKDGIYRYVLGFLLRHARLVNTGKKRQDSFAFTVLNYLENHYDEKLTLEKAASDLGYNRCYFSTLFKSSFHVGFCEHLALLRVEKSLPLLKKMPISEAAEKVGFGSLQSYYNAFRKAKSISPAAYRAKSRHNTKNSGENKMKLSEINLRDPFILTYESKYYMYGSRVGTPYEGCTWGDQTGFDVYESSDMENWSEPKCVFEKNDGFWGEYHFWAPEVHFYNGKFYLIATFKAKGKCRGTHILVCDTPNGIFTPVSALPVTPLESECLDGTLYVDKKGVPHLVYCHEWLQIDNGTVCEVALADDLSRAISEPKVLWSAKDYPNVKAIRKNGTGFVTDGPFFYRCENGDLVCIWSTHDKDTGYVELISKSSNGDIDGSWTLLDTPLFDKDGGHGMIFRDLTGNLRFVMHNPNTILLERPVITRLYDENGNLHI